MNLEHPQRLYEITPAGREAAARGVPVLLHALEGAVDAGHAGRLVAKHLVNRLDPQRVATFDVDSLLDYRSRRPAMTFADQEWADYQEPYLVLDLLHDDESQPVLLLHGSEPDLRWEAFADAIGEIVDTFQVDATVGVHGIPMGVPHTRPMTVTAHANRAELVSSYPSYFSEVRVPASAASLLEFRLGEEGKDAYGFAANVPHYLGQAEYPQAAAELIRQVSRSTGLSLPTGDLEAAATRLSLEIDRQVSEAEEVREVVSALERQYDSYFAHDSEGASALMGGPEGLPTAEDIGAEVEAFLRKEGPSPEDSLGGPLP